MGLQSNIRRIFRQYRRRQRDANPGLFSVLSRAAFALKAFLWFPPLILMFLLYRSISADVGTAAVTSVSVDSGNTNTTRVQQRPSDQVSVATSLILNPKTAEAYQRLSAASRDTAQPAVSADNDQQSGMRGPAWLLEQPNTSFTIHYRSSTEPELLLQMANSFSDAQPAALFPYKRRNGKIVYGLARGVFDSTASAESYLAAAPASAAAYPLVRSVGSLQHDVKVFRQP